MHIIQDRDDVLPSVIGKIGDILNIGRFLEPVADDILILVDSTFRFKSFYQVKVESRRRLQMDVILQRFSHDKLKMRTFCTVAIVVGTLVVNLCHRDIEHSLCPLNLRGDFRQIRDFQRCSILIDDIHHIDVMKI